MTHTKFQAMVKEYTLLIILKVAGWVGWASEDDGGVSCCFLSVSFWRGLAMLGADTVNRSGATMGEVTCNSFG